MRPATATAARRWTVVLAGRQVAGDQGGRAGRRLLTGCTRPCASTPPASCATPPRTRLWTTSSSSTTGPGVSKPRTTRGIARWSGCQWVELEIDNISLGPAEVPGDLRLAAWARPRHLDRPLLGHPRDHREHPLVRPAARRSRRSADVPARTYHLRGWLSMRQADAEAARPWLARAIAAARAARAAPAAVRIAVDAATAENMAGDHAAAGRFLDEAEAITPGLSDYPASIGLIQAQAIHCVLRGRPRHRRGGLVRR